MIESKSLLTASFQNGKSGEDMASAKVFGSFSTKNAIKKSSPKDVSFRALFVVSPIIDRIIGTGYGLRKRTRRSYDIKASVPWPREEVKDVRMLRLNQTKVETTISKLYDLYTSLATHTGRSIKLDEARSRSLSSFQVRSAQPAWLIAHSSGSAGAS